MTSPLTSYLTPIKLIESQIDYLQGEINTASSYIIRDKDNIKRNEDYIKDVTSLLIQYQQSYASLIAATSGNVAG